MMKMWWEMDVEFVISILNNSHTQTFSGKMHGPPTDILFDGTGTSSKNVYNFLQNGVQQKWRTDFRSTPSYFERPSFRTEADIYYPSIVSAY